MADVDANVLFVHAHPDDETLATAGTIAQVMATGGRAHVVTCTGGEEGTVADPELAHLMDDRDGALASVRQQEVEQACQVLGASHYWLGGTRYYRDSGRLGSAANTHQRAFWAADPRVAAVWLARLIRELRPVALVTYDPSGGYGHPDHIQTHRVAMAAAIAACQDDGDTASPSWRVPHLYWCAVPAAQLRSELADLAARAAASGETRYTVDPDPEHYPDGCHPDADISVAIDIRPYLDLKRELMALHRTQVTMIDDDTFRLPKGRGYRLLTSEWYLRAEITARREIRALPGKQVPATRLLPEGSHR